MDKFHSTTSLLELEKYANRAGDTLKVRSYSLSVMGKYTLSIMPYSVTDKYTLSIMPYSVTAKYTLSIMPYSVTDKYTEGHAI